MSGINCGIYPKSASGSVPIETTKYYTTEIVNPAPNASYTLCDIPLDQGIYIINMFPLLVQTAGPDIYSFSLTSSNSSQGTYFYLSESFTNPLYLLTIPVYIQISLDAPSNFVLEFQIDYSSPQNFTIGAVSIYVVRLKDYIV